MKLHLGIVASILFVASFFGAPQQVAAQTPPPAPCAPQPNQIKNGDPFDATPMMQNFNFSAGCPTNPGDIWTDGPLSDPTPQWSGGSFQLLIPSLTWFAKGRTVRTPVINGTAPANTTSYWWLDASTQKFIPTTTNSPPTYYSVLEYTVTSGTNGITNVRSPTPAAFKNVSWIGGLVQSVSGVGNVKVTPGANATVSLPILGSWFFVTDPTYGALCNSATHDDTAGVMAAETAAENVPGAYVIFPAGGHCFGTFAIGKSNVKWKAFGGSGYPGGSGKFPTPVAGTVTLSCFSSTSNPLLTVYPSNPSVESAGNGLDGIALDGSNGFCPVGLYVAGTKGFTLDNTSSSHFSQAAFSFEGKYLADGTHDGSVGGITSHNLTCNQTAATDGYCVQLAGTNPQGNVYSSTFTGIQATNFNQPCFRLGRSDSVSFYDVHCKSLAGGTATRSAEIWCGAQSDAFFNILADLLIYVAGTDDGCSFGGTVDQSPASGITLARVYQSDGAAPAPIFDTGSNGWWSDENGNEHRIYGVGSVQPFPYQNWGGVFGASGISPANGSPYIASDMTNLIFGTNGNQNHFCSDIRFAPSGSNNIKPGYVWDSMIGCYTDPGGGGALSFPAPSSSPSSPTYYGATGVNVNGTVAATGFRVVNWGSGGIVGIGINGTFTPLPSPQPVPLPSAPLMQVGNTLSRLPSIGYDACWDLGMVCDNATDNKTALNSNVSNPIVTNVTCAGLVVLETYASLPPGQINTTNNCRLVSREFGALSQKALITSTVNSPPPCSTAYTIDNINHGFECDQGGVPISIQQTVNGPNTLGTPGPSSAYQSNPAVALMYGLAVNNSGSQLYDTGGNKLGRTNYSMIYLHGQNNGQGDFDGYKFTGVAAGPEQTPAPGGSPIAGWEGWPDITGISVVTKAGANHQYLHPYGDNECADKSGAPSYDVTCVFATWHFERTSSPAPNSPSIWQGLDFTTKGGQIYPVDSYMRFAGGANIGLDATRINRSLTLVQNSPVPVVVMKANDWIDLNGTNSPPPGSGPYSRYTSTTHTGFEYNSTDAALEAKILGNPITEFKSTGIVLPTLLSSGPLCGSSITPVINCAVTPTPTASPPIQISGSTISRLPDQAYSTTWDKGWVCDGATDNSPLLPNTSPPTVLSVPIGSGVCHLNVAFTYPSWKGIIRNLNNAQVTTLDGGIHKRRGPTFVVVNAAPSPDAYYQAIDTINMWGIDAWNGYAVQTVINGANTLGVPTTNYIFNQWAAAFNASVTNNSGQQNYTAGNSTGRTAAFVYSGLAQQSGAGDFTTYRAYMKANGNIPTPNPSPSDWLGEPSVQAFAADLESQNNDQYLHPIGDIIAEDNGFNDTMIMMTLRTQLKATPNPADPLGAWNVHEGINFQTGGGGNQTVPMDSDFNIKNLTNIGMDWTVVNNVGGPAAIPIQALKANDWFDFNCVNNGINRPFSRYTNCPHTGIQYTSADSALELLVAGTAQVKISTTGVIIPGTLSLPALPVGAILGTTAGGGVVPIPSPSPVATATACGAPVTRTGTGLSPVTQVPVCAVTNNAGAAVPTFRCIADTVSGVSGTTVVTYGTPFNSNTTSISVISNPGQVFIALSAITGITKTGFSFTSGAVLYYWQACGF